MSSIHERITKVETNQDNFDKKFDDFMSNHFNHLRKRVDWILGLMITGSITFIGALIGVIAYLCN